MVPGEPGGEDPVLAQLKGCSVWISGFRIWAILYLLRNLHLHLFVADVLLQPAEGVTWVCVKHRQSQESNGSSFIVNGNARCLQN